MNPVANGLRRLTVVALLSVGAPVHAADSASFPDRTCGIGFGFPLNWTLSVAYPKDLACQIELEPPPEQDVVMASPGTPDEPCHLGSIHITVRRESHEAVALRSGFSKPKGEWHYMAGSVFDHVELVTGTGWRGVHASTTSHYCGSAQETHDYVLGHRLRAVSIGVHGNNLSVVESLLKTLTIQP